MEVTLVTDKGKAFETFEAQEGVVLVGRSHNSIAGHFKSSSRTSAGTTIIASPISSGFIVLTDLIVTTDKVNAATVVVQLTDGSNTVIISSSDVTDAPANYAIGFVGTWRGWKDARIELVTTGNVAATVSVGYSKCRDGLDFDTWDGQR